ncbi:unnamed protein product, partial [Urochloa humidicola]
SRLVRVLSSSFSRRLVRGAQSKAGSLRGQVTARVRGRASSCPEKSRLRRRGMAEEASSAVAAAPGKMTMVVGVDDSEPSFYALRWLLHHFFPPGQPPPQQQYRLVVVTAVPSATVGIAGPGALMDVRAFVEADLKRAAQRVIDKAKDLCAQLQVSDAEFEALEGDARSVLCDAVERHHAEMLIVGSHGYGAIKRAVLGSVSDYCAHHAHCTVMIVKKPKHKH